MSAQQSKFAELWTQIGPKFLPFADAATKELPLGRLLRLSLFQVSVGMAIVLLNGTLNRVMIVELAVPAWLVSTMVALPLLFAPFRALIGHRSDNHPSVLGWRRVPYIWFGTLVMFGGICVMPFALMALSDPYYSGPNIVGYAGAAIAFLAIGYGLHTSQTAGLALATDLAPAESRPRVVALLYVMLLLGMVGSSIVFGWALQDFHPVRLIQVLQSAAGAALFLNVIALWQQEPRNPKLTDPKRERPSFKQSWSEYKKNPRAFRVLVAVGLGTAAFSMQDILLEPYGGEVLGLSVSETTLLTAILASGSLIGFGYAANRLSRGSDPFRIAGLGSVVGLFAFAAVILADPLGSANLFRVGTALIGLGGGLFAVGMLTASMDLAPEGKSGLALGAWGAVQATAAGIAIALGGAIRDVVGNAAEAGALGPALITQAAGYGVVYHIEIILLFATLIAVGPLVRRADASPTRPPSSFGLAEFPS
ncbi:MAG: BCD family MFS transporter [Pseudomonadota bacterium]